MGLAKDSKRAWEQGEVAFLAGGCFWGLEELLRSLSGVLDVEVGYMGGNLAHATYDQVKTGDTGHAETVRVVFDPRVRSFAHLLCEFFRMHDPTTLHRQGNDRGSQYRSAIFFVDEKQERVARKMISLMDESRIWENPVVTEVSPAKDFWPAEPEHQDYLQRYPDGYSCHYFRHFNFEFLLKRVSDEAEF